MVLNNEFSSFDTLIRPSDAELRLCKRAHEELRRNLRDDESIEKIHVADFLQGSYPRNTMNRTDEKNDVDVILVTTLHEAQFDPDTALALFVPFLKTYYPDQWELNGRSINIQLEDVHLDLVPTSAPSEARIMMLRALEEEYNERVVAKATQPDDLLDPDEIVGPSGSAIASGDWAEDPLRIPDRHAKCWQNTHPLATLAWTTQKNRQCNKRFLRVVRAVKWWRKHVSGGPKHPKSYPIEHMVGDHCPSNISSVAEGVTLTLEAMLGCYEPYAARGVTPWLAPRGLEGQDNNVLSLVTREDFSAFVGVLRDAARHARLAFDEKDPHESGKLWQRVLGERFPVPRKPTSGGGSRGGFTPREEPIPQPVGGRFAKAG